MIESIVSGKAIIEEATNRERTLQEPKNFKVFPGKGVKGSVGEDEVIVGTPQFVEESARKMDQNLLRTADHLLDQGKSLVYVVVDGKVSGVIAVADELIFLSTQSGARDASETGLVGPE